MKQRPFLRSSRPRPLQKVYLQVVAEPPRWFTSLGKRCVQASAIDIGSIVLKLMNNGGKNTIGQALHMNIWMRYNYTQKKEEMNR